MFYRVGLLPELTKKFSTVPVNTELARGEPKQATRREASDCQHAASLVTSIINHKNKKPASTCGFRFVDPVGFEPTAL